MSTALPPREAIAHRELVRAAVLAPSPDNNQPWRFVSQEDRLLVYLDPSRALPSDVHAMFDLTGLGAAVENACLAARELGHQPHVEYAAERGDAVECGSKPAAAITCHPSGRPDPLFSYLDQRSTCRKLYSTRPVSQGTLRRIAEEASMFPEVRLDWVTDRRRIRSFGRLLAASDRIRFEYEPFHNELFRQLRFTVEEAERTRDGLDLRTLELPPGAGAVLKTLRPWKRMRWVHSLGLGGLLTLPSTLSVWKSGAIGLISVPQPTASSFLRGGQALQRIWLQAAAEGLALHPLGSLPIFLAHWEQLQGKRLAPRHQGKVQRLAERLRQLLPETRQGTLQIMFRLGYAAPPKHRSMRRLVDDAHDAFDSSETGVDT